MEIKTFIEEYLHQARLMQVSTAKDNQPWTCTLYFAFDSSFNLYWISKTSRRHSEEIRFNQKVAGTIVLPHTPGDKVRGLQFQGIAKELGTSEEAVEGMKHYAERYGMKADKVQQIINNTDGHVCYRISPTLFILFDEVNFPQNPRQEYLIK